MRKWWAKLTGLVIMVSLLLPEMVLAAGPAGGPPGSGGGYPEIYRLGSLVDQSVQ